MTCLELLIMFRYLLQSNIVVTYHLFELITRTNPPLQKKHIKNVWYMPLFGSAFVRLQVVFVSDLGRWGYVMQCRSIEFKFIVKKGNNEVVWETTPNREVCVEVKYGNMGGDWCFPTRLKR